MYEFDAIGLRGNVTGFALVGGLSLNADIVANLNTGDISLYGAIAPLGGFGVGVDASVGVLEVENLPENYDFTGTFVGGGGTAAFFDPPIGAVTEFAFSPEPADAPLGERTHVWFIGYAGGAEVAGYAGPSFTGEALRYNSRTGDFRLLPNRNVPDWVPWSQ